MPDHNNILINQMYLNRATTEGMPLLWKYVDPKPTMANYAQKGVTVQHEPYHRQNRCEACGKTYWYESKPGPDKCPHCGEALPGEPEKSQTVEVPATPKKADK